MNTHLASFQAAHDVVGHLIAVLTPLPNSTEISCSDYAPDKPRVQVYAHRDLGSLLAWQGTLGGALTVLQYPSGQVRWTLTVVVGGIPVEALTLLDAPSDAEEALCARWMDEHGDDPAEWSPKIRAAYANTVATLHPGGAL